MKQKSKDIVITTALRTAIGKYKGIWKKYQAHDLGKDVIKKILNNSKIEPNFIDEIIMGQVLTTNTGQNPARQAAIKAGIPKEKTGYVINQVCGSGLRSIVLGYQSILLGDAKIIIAGGQESMTNSKKEIMLKDGLIDAYNNYHMGVTAENVAKKFNISRQEQDEFALNSQKKTEKAFKDNKFSDELVRINHSGNILDKDEHPRTNLKITDLEKLKTVFKDNGTVTPGNSSGINDGAAALLLTSLEHAEKKSIKPLVKIVSWASVGVEPTLMGLGPIDAVSEAIKKAKWKLNEIDLFEINEAFAAQSIAVIRELGIDQNKVNVNGGAIALGHPIGASGTRIFVTLIHEMLKRDSKKGLATLCIGGGMGVAMCIERKWNYLNLEKK